MNSAESPCRLEMKSAAAPNIIELDLLAHICVCSKCMLTLLLPISPGDGERISDPATQEIPSARQEAEQP
jgi:hypothetical protein